MYAFITLHKHIYNHKDIRVCVVHTRTFIAQMTLSVDVLTFNVFPKNTLYI